MTNTASTFYPQLTGSRGPVTNICQHVISLPLPPAPPLPRLPAPTPTLRIGIIGLVIGVHLNYRRLLDYKKAGRKILLSEAAIKYAIDWDRPNDEIVWLAEGEQLKSSDCCPFGKTMVYINSDGKIFPCVAVWHSQRFKPLGLREAGLQGALDNAASIPCKECFCAGGPEWKNLISLRGVIFGLKVTWTQIQNSLLAK